MKIKHLPIIGILATLATGCTLEPRYQRPALPVAAAYPVDNAGQTNHREDGSPSAPSPQHVAAEIGWRDFFGDPRLRQLVELALSNNRDLRVAVLNVEQVRAQYQIQRAALLPAINAVASQDKEHLPSGLSLPSRTTYNVGAAASWEIDLFGKTQSLAHQALAQYFATAEARRAAEISLVSQVAHQYLTARALDEQLQITRASVTTAQQSYQIAKARYDAGVGSELDLREAQSVVNGQQALLASQIRSRAQAENALVLLVGEPLPADLPEPLPLNSQVLLADIPAGLPSDLLARRPDLMAAEQQLRAAHANIGAARAAFFPSLSLTGQFGTMSTTLSGLFKAGSAAWSFAPQLTLPIFEGGRNLANLDLAHAQQKIALARYEKAIQQAFREVADGLAARSTYDEQIDALRRQAADQQRRLELSTLRYQHGTDSYLSVLTAQTDLYEAQQSLVATRLARLTNLVDLYQYLGGGWLAHTGDAPRPADTLNTIGKSPPS